MLILTISVSGDEIIPQQSSPSPSKKQKENISISRPDETPIRNCLVAKFSASKVGEECKLPVSRKLKDWFSPSPIIKKKKYATPLKNTLQMP